MRKLKLQIQKILDGFVEQKVLELENSVTYKNGTILHNTCPLKK
jgi:hypothetical protein